MNKANQIQMPEVFSFIRRVECSDALMDNVEVIERTNRAVKSYEGESVKRESDNKESANIVTGDLAFSKSDEAKISFSLKFLPIMDIKPWSCNDYNVFRLFLDLMRKKKESGDLDMMVKRLSTYYAYNIANARWLWRNRDVANSVTVYVEVKNADKESVETIVIEHAEDIPEDIALNSSNMIDFKSLGISDEVKNKIFGIAKHIYNAFSWKEDAIYMEIEAKLNLIPRSQMFPSQVFPSSGSKSKGRQYQIDPETGKPMMTMQKIGNALRTFDVWYPEYPDVKIPLPIEMFGNSTTIEKNFRGVNESASMYMKRFLDGDELEENEMIFLLAYLVRGGLFVSVGDKTKKKRGKRKKQSEKQEKPETQRSEQKIFDDSAHGDKSKKEEASTPDSLFGDFGGGLDEGGQFG